MQRSHERLAVALANGGLDQPIHLRFGALGHLSLRRMLFDLLEEYGRHTGHADLLREAVDGRVGEDPPMDWRPPVPSLIESPMPTRVTAHAVAPTGSAEHPESGDRHGQEP